MIPSIMSGSLIRDTPPCARMSAGTRSSAITATAPAASAILACSGVTTSMMTPPLSISAMPRFTRAVPVCSMLAEESAAALFTCVFLLKPDGIATSLGRKHRPPMSRSAQSVGRPGAGYRITAGSAGATPVSATAAASASSSGSCSGYTVSPSSFSAASAAASHQRCP